MKKSLIYIAATVLTAVSPYNALAGDGTETAVDNFAMEETSSEETSANETAIDEAKNEPEENMEEYKEPETNVSEKQADTAETSDDSEIKGADEKTETDGEEVKDEEPSEADAEPSEEGAFSDVEADIWYADAVDFVTSRGIMSGTSETTFSPDAPATRGMVALIIKNINGTDEKVYWSYLDVPEDAWYADAAAWCSDKDIMEGYGNGYFGPDDSITREQLVSILYRYAQYRNFSNLDTTGVELLKYGDYGDISGYAGGPMQWALKNSILSGNEDGTLDPKGIASRAETAQIIRNFMIFYTL